MRKKLKILIVSKIAQTIFIKFSGFIVHSKLNNITLSAFSEKIPETEKKKKKKSLCDRRLTERLTQLTNLVQIRYLRSPWKYLNSFFS